MSCEDIICSDCGKVFKRGHRSNKEQCPQCSAIRTKNLLDASNPKSISSLEELHQLTHKTPFSYTCKECGQTIKKLYDKYKDKDFEFLCPHCGFIKHYDFDAGWAKRKETWKITRPKKVKPILRKHVIQFEDFLERLDEERKSKYTYDKDEYKGYKKPMKIICKIHGEFYQMPSEHVSRNICPKCAALKRSESKTKTGEISFWSKLKRNPDYDYSKVIYKKSREKVEVICKKHGSFWISPNKLLFGRGCPHCKNSKGENSVRHWLLQQNIKFERQKRFKDLIYHQPLAFDFYLPDYNCCIEYDGEQHFKPVNFRKAYKDKAELLRKFEENKIRDKLKDDYCKKNEIGLLRISYFDNIESKLMEWKKNLD